ncbi:MULTISPECIES: hypothetical protein [unclassified Sphingomonas]|nr:MULTISPECIES: hypothetical protein [unclassified Sphingomonas]
MTGHAIRKYFGPVVTANRRIVVGGTILSIVAIIEGLLAYSGSLA